MKTRRFVYEFANYMQDIVSAMDIEESAKLEKLRKLSRTVFNVERGFITITEAMRILSYLEIDD